MGTTHSQKLTILQTPFCLFQTYHITLELGHKAEVKPHIWDNPSHTVVEQEPTHQWECWVNAKVGDMSKYVDKVVFNLHETFPKPKRGKIKDVLMGVYLKSFHNTLITSHNSYYRNTKKKIVKISICHICCTLYAKRLSDIIVFDTFLVLL